ncbi:granulin a isoform X2 [Salarias fasciatus]|uniref:granulin a isoform X2 n=1 Tax=Salarias fasciatus TaxID=181472 RepID=UPI0011767A9F|nr:progranulin-like isoform X2 [Salarias fasciatus]
MQRWAVVCWALLALLALAGAYECPDGGRCGEGGTCCGRPADGYDCCPLEQAECCGDHAHCCPADTVCDPSTSSCVNATASVPWVKRTSARRPGLSRSFRMIQAYAGEDDSNVCPDQSRCPAEFSCQRTLTGFGCCPLTQGVPCPDGRHCCPDGHRCSADGRSCIREDVVTTVVCRDGTSECPGGTTCCETPEGTWGCCPLENAVCCSDKVHCCPEGSACDVEHSRCVSSDSKTATPMWAKLPARTRAEWENLKDGEVTAAEADEVKPEKVPERSTAGVPHSERGVALSSVTSAASGGVVACDETSACPDDTTCCKTQQGEWGCCPLPKAVCCSDGEHCCPTGQKCNLAEQTCESGLRSEPWVEKIPAIRREAVREKAVQCDETSACPDDTTCCKTQQGEWGCCPLPKAVCCSDGEHCCPTGQKCNLAEQTCESGLRSEPWVEKIPAIRREAVREKVVQCDETSACPDDTTCCKTQQGEWGCCPLPKAVCCSDGEHCCPTGQKCNLAEQTCESGLRSEPWVEKIPAIRREAVREKVVQCDETSACPDDTTCCKTQQGEWGCCPLPKAVCCSDGEHCCPTGQKCNLAEQTCESGLRSEPWVEKIPAIRREAVREKVVQCDETSACPDDTTCCKTQQGEWGCCPLPKAVCCSDGEHCCPTGQKCNLAEQTCESGLRSEPWVEKIPAIRREAVREKVVQCDETSACPDDTTCCEAKGGGWGCCPLAKAVCCDDHENCCPEGTTCNLTTLTCEGRSGSTPMKQKIPALTTRTPAEDEDDEGAAPRAQCTCPASATCCFMKASQSWGCCPLPNAVCCPDQEHCCPHGYTCSTASRSCEKLALLQLQPVPLARVSAAPVGPLAHRDVQCDETTKCPDGQTCCRISATSWGCCPSPQAVCCSDMLHCCPNGYTCTEAGQCIQSAGFDWRVLLGNRNKPTTM